MYLKGMSLAAAPRYYPTLEFLLQKLMPQSIIDGQLQHQQYAHERINKRLDKRSNRPDFMTPFMKNNVDFTTMSRAEILSTFNFIIVGGAETSATVLTGLFNHLSRNEAVMRRLCDEIRGAFKREEDITVDACKDLPYLEAVLNEGLRMCNPIPSGLPRVVPPGGDTYCGVYLPGGVSAPSLQRYSARSCIAKFHFHSAQLAHLASRPASASVPSLSIVQASISTMPIPSCPNAGYPPTSVPRPMQTIS